MLEERKLDKSLVFDLLRKRGVAKAWLQFSGGHDQGAVEEIRLFANAEADPENDDGEVLEQYLGYRRVEDETQPSGYRYETVPKDELKDDERLADMLCMPVDIQFGSWADQPSTWGTLVWNVSDASVVMEYEEDQPVQRGRIF